MSVGVRVSVCGCEGVRVGMSTGICVYEVLMQMNGKQTIANISFGIQCQSLGRVGRVTDQW